MAKKLLMIVGDYVEDYEAMVPLQALMAVGHEVQVVCPGKRAGDYVRTAVHDFEGAQTYSEKEGHRFFVTADFAGLEPAGFDGLVIPGGRSPEYLRLDESVLALVRHFFETGKPVACICHGVQLLCAADVLRGYRCSGYGACAPEVRAAGAEYVDLAMDQALTDRNLVTAFAWPSHPAWLAQFLALLGTRITH
ncbi:intracellular protease%2C PfpI family [Bordetella trematum]|uniref:DJ-1/PfpI family protein n=1 Tax=Bordetella trematum TaxID=123899 RepID=UPI00046E5651|nr:DJ-1/PfpI family protein [Bordetella trematum]SAI45948.1 intracellular protease%2C PfpI family [Bordetella trematum]SPU51395.1 intracellular protease, PfpI family [Bordetella trematum]VDH08683.1 intracellular protease, PfpI family [Bordetella trematum]